MIERDPHTVPIPRGLARVTLACRDREEFLREFVPRCRQGVFVATRSPPAVGTRVRIKMTLLDGSVAYCGEALVAVHDQEGSCPGIRVLPEMPELVDSPPDAPAPGVGLVEYLAAERPAGGRRPAPLDAPGPGAPPPAVGPLDPAGRPPSVPAPVPIGRIALERTFRPPPDPLGLPPAEEPVASWRSLLADRLEELAAGALRAGNLKAAAAHCQLAVQADPRRTGPRALLQRLGAEP